MCQVHVFTTGRLFKPNSLPFWGRTFSHNSFGVCILYCQQLGLASVPFNKPEYFLLTSHCRGSPIIALSFILGAQRLLMRQSLDKTSGHCVAMMRDWNCHHYLLDREECRWGTNADPVLWFHLSMDMQSRETPSTCTLYKCLCLWYQCSQRVLG